MRDVKIAFVKEKKSNNSVSFTFECAAFDKIGSEYICPVIIDDRLYFEPTIKRKGMKLGDKGYKKSGRMCFPSDELNEFAPFIGEHAIYFDKILGFYYVKVELPEFFNEKGAIMKEQTIFLPELNWFSRARSNSDAYSDISVSLIKASGSPNKKAISFVLRENALKHFTSEYLTFAINKNRIFFKDASVKQGYKITIKKPGSNPNGYIRATLNNDTEETLKSFIGDYELKFDKYYELYYIEKAED